MIDPNDNSTLDAFVDDKPVKKRGRPITATPETKRAQNAARNAKHKKKIKLRLLCTEIALAKINALHGEFSYTEKRLWNEFLAYANGQGQNLTCQVEFIDKYERQISESTNYEGLRTLIDEGREIMSLAP